MLPDSGCSFKCLKYLAGNGIPCVHSFRLFSIFLTKKLQFTITSAPEDPYVSIHVRQVGDWTQTLGERVGAGPSVVAALTQAAMKGKEKDDSIYGTRGDYVELDNGAGSRPLPAVRIDGPYGAPAEDVFNVEVAVLIGAGIGK